MATARKKPKSWTHSKQAKRLLLRYSVDSPDSRSRRGRRETRVPDIHWWYNRVHNTERGSVRSVWFSTRLFPPAEMLFRRATHLLVVLAFIPLPMRAALADAQSSDEGVAALVQLLGTIDDTAFQLDLLKGIQAGFRGRRRVAMPKAWPTTYEKLSNSESEDVRRIATILALTFGDQQAIGSIETTIQNEEKTVAQRREALAALVQARTAKLDAILLGLLDDENLRGDAITALAAFTNPKISQTLLEKYPEWTADLRRLALDTLSSRVTFARELLGAVAADQVDRTQLNAETIRKLRLLNDPQIDAAIRKTWGEFRDTTEDKVARIAELKALLEKPATVDVDLSRGRVVFSKTCQQCHKLFGEGGEIGPEITGSNRNNLDYLLVNIVDPNAMIGKDYQAWNIWTDDGQTLVGLIINETDRVVTLRTTTKTVAIPVEEIEEREQSDISMMPQNLLAQLTELQLRDLIAYLGTPIQVPLP